MPPATPTPRTLRAATAGSLAADAATVEAVQLLASSGMRPLLLKGPALARMLYGPGEERSWDDADLLVAPRDHQRAIDVLVAIGFRPLITNPLERGSVPHAVNLVRAGRTVGESAPESIDLHVSFSGVGAAPEVLWRSLSGNRERLELFGRTVDVPSTHARLALVALHAAAHGRPNLRSLRDLERAVARYGTSDWSVAFDLAREWDAVDYFIVGLRLEAGGRRLLGALEITHEPGPAAIMRGEGMPRAQRSLEQLGRTDGVTARARLGLRKAFPSPEVMRTWKPLARRGRLGLLVAYAWRPPWLVWQLLPALHSYVRAVRR